jgi:hypothetical protein
MAQAIDLLVGAAASAGDKTVVTLAGKTPFLPGRDAIAHFSAHGQAGSAPAWAIDGSDDNSTFVADIATSVVAGGHDSVPVKLYKYMRPSVTTAAGSTDGTLSIWLEAV